MNSNGKKVLIGLKPVRTFLICEKMRRIFLTLRIIKYYFSVIAEVLIKDGMVYLTDL